MTDALPKALRGGPGHLWLYGHRGARGIIAENTIASIDHALDVGLRALEIDVLAIGDGTPVVTHNPRLLPDLTRDPEGEWVEAPGPRLMDLDLERLRGFDVGAARPGSPYAARFPDQAIVQGLRVPTLDTVLTHLAARPGGAPWLMLEVKSDPRAPDETPPLPDYVASVLRLVAAHGLERTTMLQAFDWALLAECARQAPSIARSHLSGLPQPGWDGTVYPGSPWLDGLEVEAAHTPEVIASLGGIAWAPFYADLDEDAMARARDHGLLVNPFTVNEPEAMERMIELGVDGFVTDYPGRAQRVLAERGLSWRREAG